MKKSKNGSECTKENNTQKMNNNLNFKKMERNNNRKGIWIPIEMIENKELDWSNKALLSEIYSLHEQKKGCIASDQHFANLLGFKHPSTAQKRVDTLVDMNLIHKKVITKNGKIIGKILTPLQPMRNIGKITSQKNNPTIQENQTNSSNENNGVVPGQPKNSSLESNVVVPGSQDSSSTKNTNNTKNNTIKKNTNNNTSGPIQNVDKIVEGSTIISQLFSNNPYAIQKFKNSCKEVLNNSNEPIKVIYNTMDHFFRNYKNWENDLIACDPDRYIKKIYNTKTKDPELLGLVYGYTIRILQHRTK